MLAATETEQLRRALAAVIAVVLGLGVLSAAARSDGLETDPGRAAVVDGGTSSGSSSPADGVDQGADGGSPGVAAATEALAPLGPVAVPAPGSYQYDVDEVRDGESSTRTEEREITLLGEEGASSIVQVVARSDGERQVSVLDWSASGVLVRSTRIETDDGSTRDCTWDPAFLEFGSLSAVAEWVVDSTCATDVAGLPTVFAVSGTGRVVQEAEIVHAGAPVRVWQVVRDRTTTITAMVGTDEVEQVVHEVGTFFVDPARGLALRSDVTVTLSGARQGTTRRTSVLIAG